MTFASADTALRAAERRANSTGQPVGVAFRDDLRNFQGGYILTAPDPRESFAIVQPTRA